MSTSLVSSILISMGFLKNNLSMIQSSNYLNFFSDSPPSTLTGIYFCNTSTNPSASEGSSSRLWILVVSFFMVEFIGIVENNSMRAIYHEESSFIYSIGYKVCELSVVCTLSPRVYEIKNLHLVWVVFGTISNHCFTRAASDGQEAVRM